MIIIDASVAETLRTVLRRPDPDDLDAVYRIHSDPETNKFNPAGPDPDFKASAARLQGWLDHWKIHQFGYWTVQVDGVTAGFAGLQRAQWLDHDILNLYYRFAPEFWGQGYAPEVARYAVDLGMRTFPTIPVLARTKAANTLSQRTALKAGLTRRADLDRDDGTGMAVIFVSSWPT